MKFFYFLPLALLVLIPNAYAYRGDTYTDIENTDGTHTWIGGLEPYIDSGMLDSSGKKIYKQFIVEDLPTSVRVHNGKASFIFDKTSCSARIYSGGVIDNENNFVLNSDSYVPKVSVNGSGTWSVVTSVNNAACVTNIIQSSNSIEVSGTKTSSAGIFTVRYLKEDGKPLKTILEATNLSSLTDRRFGVTQTQEVPRIIMWGGQQKDLGNFVGTTFDRTWLENNKANLLQYTNRLAFDMIDAWDNLESVKVNSVNGNIANISFNFLRNAPILAPNQKLVIDPQFGPTAGNSDNMSLFSTGTCSTFNTVSATETAVGSTGANCFLKYAIWNTTTIPDAAAITNSSLIIQTSGNTNSPTIQIVALKDNPKLVSNSTNWDNIRNNATVFSSFVGSATTNVDLDLGTTADLNIRSHLPENYFAVGFRKNPELMENKYIGISNSGSMLTLTYQDSLSPPTGLSCTGMPFAYSCSWTAVNAQNVTGYYIAHSPDNSTWYSGNVTSIANVTSVIYNGTSFGINESNYIRVNATIGIQESTSSNTVYATTDNIPDAPSIAATPVSSSQINIVRTAGASDGGDIVDDYNLQASINGAAFANLVTNSTIANYYNHTGLSSGDTVVYKWRDGNDVGWSSYSSNSTARTYTTTTGTVTLTATNIGDIFNGTALVTITAASPSPVTVSLVRVLQNGSTVTSDVVSQSIADGGSYTFENYPYLITDDNPHSYQMEVVVSNNTGTVTLTSAATDITREYDPDYFTAIDPTQGMVNYTLTRTADQDTINLKTNREKLAADFNIECNYKTMTDAALGGNGTWHNYTSVVYMNDTLSDTAGTYYYIDCYNDGLLFSTVSYTNSSMLLSGIQVFDDTYGTFIGVPVGVFFIVLIAGMANQRTAPMWIVVILAVAGIMSTIGFFTLETNVWALALIAALLGIIVGRKLF